MSLSRDRPPQKKRKRNTNGVTHTLPAEKNRGGGSRVTGSTERANVGSKLVEASEKTSMERGASNWKDVGRQVDWQFVGAKKSRKEASDLVEGGGPQRVWTKRGGFSSDLRKAVTKIYHKFTLRGGGTGEEALQKRSNKGEHETGSTDRGK